MSSRRRNSLPGVLWHVSLSEFMYSQISGNSTENRLLITMVSYLRVERTKFSGWYSTLNIRWPIPVQILNWIPTWKRTEEGEGVRRREWEKGQREHLWKLFSDHEFRSRVVNEHPLGWILWLDESTTDVGVSLRIHGFPLAIDGKF